MVNLEGRNALVTGASRGIGRSIATALVEAGASVSLVSRSEADLEALAEDLRTSARGKVITVPGDLTDHNECDRVVAESIRQLGGVDILINNAGLGIFKSIEEMTWQEWRQQIDLNLGAVWACTKAALDSLKAHGEGWVINIGSLAGRNPFNQGTGYNASKFGLVGMTEAMMLDVRKHGIRVSIVMPGSVNTHFDGNHPGERDWKLEPSDCALAVMQLLSFPKEAHVSRIEMRPAIPDASKTRR